MGSEAYSLSFKLGKQALSIYLGEEIESFHQVLLLQNAKDKDQLPFSSSLLIPPLLYLCLSKYRVTLVEVGVLREQHSSPSHTASHSHSHTHTHSSSSLDESTTEGGDSRKTGKDKRKRSKKAKEALTIRFAYSMLSEVIVHPTREDRFVFVLTDKRGDKVPEILKFSSCWRKNVLENLLALHNTRMILDHNRVDPLPVRFQIEKKKLAHACRHPSEQYYHRLPIFTKGDGSFRIFHRAGYLFLLPRLFSDKYELLHNRHCSTYVRLGGDEEDIVSEGGPATTTQQRKKEHLIVRFLPAKSVTDVSSVIVDRNSRGVGDLNDLLSFLPEAAHRPVLTSTDESDFHLWTESVAHTIALAESREESLSSGGNGNGRDYFVPSRGVYHKKMNIVGDRALWTCYQVHIYTKHREIGVIGLRRKFLPPLLDSYQDILFVLYSRYTLHFHPAKNFMQRLEHTVDSISPIVTPVPFRERTMIQQLHSDVLKSRDGQRYRVGEGAVHRTYYDLNILKARSDMLLLPLQLWQWLADKRSMHNRDPDPLEWEARGVSVLLSEKKNNHLAKTFRTLLKTIHPYGGLHEVIPRHKFIDKECSELAETFCKRLYNLLTRTEGDDVEADIKNPLSLISRMNDGFNTGVEKETKHSKLNGFTPNEEWNSRLAQYLAYCVDGGLLQARPQSDSQTSSGSSEEKISQEGYKKILSSKQLQLSIALIVETCKNPAEVTRETKQVLDCILDYLLCMKLKPPPPKTPPLPITLITDETTLLPFSTNLPTPTEWISSFPKASTFLPSASPQLFSRLLSSATSTHNIMHISSSTTNLSSTIPTDTYQYIFVPNVLYKLRSATLMKNFTCNEEVLYRLLETNYIQNLEERERQIPSLLPFLLCSILTNMTYNLPLIRVACEKIVYDQMDDLVLIGPLINLCKGGNIHTKVAAFKSLASMAEKRATAIEAAGGIGLAIWHIFVSKSAQLIEACVQLLVDIVPNKGPIPRQLKNPIFAIQLVQILRSRVKTQERYHNLVLSLTASLIRKLAIEDDLLDQFLDYKADDELVKIMAGYEAIPGVTLRAVRRGVANVRTTFRYRSILKQITAALGTLYLLAGTHVMEIKNSQMYDEHASHLVITLKRYSYTPDYLQLCWNILAALRYLVNPKLIELKEEKTIVDAKLDRHLALWKRLEEQNDLANRLSETDKTAVAFLDSTKEDRSDGVQDKIRIANDVQRKVSWFRYRLKKSAECAFDRKKITDPEKWVVTPKHRSLIENKSKKK